jgi:hypothetical protein
VALCSGLAPLANNHFGGRTLLRRRLRLHAINATALNRGDGYPLPQQRPDGLKALPAGPAAYIVRKKTGSTARRSREPEGAIVFQRACKMGLEGLVSKRVGSRYRSGRSPDWLKFKNPDAPSLKREAEVDWDR